VTGCRAVRDEVVEKVVDGVVASATERRQFPPERDTKQSGEVHRIDVVPLRCQWQAGMS
jgi:hypothetical protein